MIRVEGCCCWTQWFDVNTIITAFYLEGCLCVCVCVCVCVLIYCVCVCVTQYEEADRKYYTMDDGETVFIDLLQLVEFHQINRGILPARLKHPCVRVAL